MKIEQNSFFILFGNDEQIYSHKKSSEIKIYNDVFIFLSLFENVVYSYNKESLAIKKNCIAFKIYMLNTKYFD